MVNAQTPKYCGTTQATNKIIVDHPEVAVIHEQMEKAIQEWIKSQKNYKTNDEQVYIIPIVFHVIHNYGDENISDDQIKDEVEVLNRDYRKLNADTSVVVNDFKSIIADCHIEFRLAQIDENGFCTNGIDRIESYETYNGGDEAKLNSWAQHKYLNVWIVNSMKDGVAGYAYKPDVGAMNPQIDGIMILSQYIGRIGTGSEYDSRALTHEIGHYLNLDHPWGSTNSPGVACGDDGVNDTPETMGWDHCPSESASKVCDTAVVENYQNYMDYSYCSKMYTEGQKTRMQATLNNSIAYRNNLWTEANLVATGTNDGYSQTCEPKADFYADHYFVCEGGSVKFTDVSWNGTETGRTWSFSSGTASSTTDQVVDVTFNTAGWQDVSLTATNAQGSDIKTAQAYVYVSPLTADHVAPFSENFSSESDFNNEWITINNDKNPSVWQYSKNYGFSGPSVEMYAYESRPNDDDELMTPSFDLSGMSSIYLNFKYACATTAFSSDDMTDELKILASKDCGESWIQLKVIDGTDLINNGNWATSFAPNSTTTWTDYSAKISSLFATANTRFKFEYISGGSANNLYVDNINVSSTSGIKSIDDNDQYSFEIFPNPSKDNVTIKINADSKQHAEIKLVNMLGQNITNVYSGDITQGENELNINISNLSTGIYTIYLKVGNTLYQKKLTKTAD